MNSAQARSSEGRATRSAARHLRLSGQVQGVGFRPFVFRLAHRLGLSGRVWNARGSVEIEVQGAPSDLAIFEGELLSSAPPLAKPRLVLSEPLQVSADRVEFRIESSDAAGPASIFVPPDRFACEDCLGELLDPDDRRHRYPFINCTQCGPRYTLIERLPYDRANTTMARFELCADCRREYEDPLDRRHHAEPLACAACGPALRLQRRGRDDAATGDAALREALQLLHAGCIVAVKGIGGYHLLCDARNDRAVQALRERKHRPDKPLAVMYPSLGPDGLERLRRDASPDALEATALTDPARPIVLVTKRSGSTTLAAQIAPGLDEVGVFLPYSPLHELLLGEFGGPLVATSGNLSGEPVITDEAMADDKLGAIADALLHHDRPIARPADDPVLRRSAGAMRPLRLGRGTAPLELELPRAIDVPTLATGAHLKNCLALAWERRVVISPHIGSMDGVRSLEVFAQVAADLQRLYGIEARRIACDAHPGYATSRWALRSGLPCIRVAHHTAHASALAAEHGLARGPLLVFCWDGLGLGEDGSLWGGETLLGEPGDWRRIASLRPFRLPGGDRAAVQPWRSAASLCWHTARDDAVLRDAAPAEHRALLRAAWERGLQSPWTSSAGRLFDAAAALVLGLHATSHEAQAPMRLEALAASVLRDDIVGLPALCWQADEAGLPRLDWAPLLPMLSDATQSPARRALLFHEALAVAIADLAQRVVEERARCGEPALLGIGFSGGVFQNRLLLEACAARLAARDRPMPPLLLPTRAPANDAAICLGQIAEVAAGGGQAC